MIHQPGAALVKVRRQRLLGILLQLPRYRLCPTHGLQKGCSNRQQWQQLDAHVPTCRQLRPQVLPSCWCCVCELARRTCCANALSAGSTMHLLPLENMGLPFAPENGSSSTTAALHGRAAWQHACTHVHSCQRAASQFTFCGHAEEQRAMHQQRRIQHAALPVLQCQLQLQRQRECAVCIEALLEVPACRRMQKVACAHVAMVAGKHRTAGSLVVMHDVLTCKRLLLSTSPGSLPQCCPVLLASQQRRDPGWHLAEKSVAARAGLCTAASVRVRFAQPLLLPFACTHSRAAKQVRTLTLTRLLLLWSSAQVAAAVSIAAHSTRGM